MRRRRWCHPVSVSALSVHSSPLHMVRHRNFIFGIHMHIGPQYMHIKYLVILTCCGMYILLVMISIERSETARKKHIGNPRQIQSETKCSQRQNSVRDFFSNGQEKIFSRLNLSRITYHSCISYAIF